MCTPRRSVRPQPRIAVLGAVFAAVVASSGAQAQRMVRASVSWDGQQANGDSGFPAASADGRFVAFESAATNLVPGDTNGMRDVFVRDLRSATTERISVSSSGSQALAGSSERASISADGRYVLFGSWSSDLAPNDTSLGFDLLLRDRLLGTTELVDVSTSGIQANGNCRDAALTPDARFVAFASDASTLVPGVGNGFDQIYVRDRWLGTTECASRNTGGGGGNGDSQANSCSADGRIVAFTSYATDLGGLGGGSILGVFARDRQTSAIERVDVSTAGIVGDSANFATATSADGRFVAFVSASTNLVAGDTNGRPDVFVRDRWLGTTELVSVALAGGVSNGQVVGLALSADARWVAFGSTATDLAPGDTTVISDVACRDRVLGTTALVSTPATGANGDGNSGSPHVSGDGRYVVFTSYASNLVLGDTNARTDVFARYLPDALPTFCAGDGIDTSHTSDCPCANHGAPGNGCANSVNANGANLLALGTASVDDVRLFASGMPTSSTAIYLQGDALDDAVFGDGVRCTGGALVRLRARPSLAGASSFPDPSDMTTLSARGGVWPGLGVRRYYQTYYRNAAATFCPMGAFNVTNGVLVDW